MRLSSKWTLRMGVVLMTSALIGAASANTFSGPLILTVPAANPPAGASGGGAGGGVTSAEMSQLTTQVKTISEMLKKINDTQTSSWNNYVKMQSDVQFTGPSASPGPDQSQYPLIHQNAYQLGRSVINADAFTSSVAMQQFKVLNSLLCQSSGSKDPNSQANPGLSAYQNSQACTTDSQNGLLIGNEFGLLDNLQYASVPNSPNDPYSAMLSQGQDLTSSIVSDPNVSVAVSNVPVYVIGQLIAARTPQFATDGKGNMILSQGQAAVTGPSLMQALGQTVQSAFTPAWEDGLAQASALDVMRAQTELMAVNNYIQFEQLKTSQQQLALTVAMMAEIESKK